MTLTTTIIRSKKRKRTVALHIEADGSLVVSAPMRTSLNWINAFIREKAGWIARRRADLSAHQSAPSPELKDGGLVPFLGKELRLSVTYDQGESAGMTSTSGLNPSLLIPLLPNLPPDILQAEIKTSLTLWYKKQARHVFAERMAHWAEQIGVTPQRMILTNPRGRWGSCSAKDEIRLNWRLIMASRAVLDYVIVHELCHIPHKNHGKRFWALVERFTPQAKRTRQELRNFEKLAFQALFS